MVLQCPMPNVLKAYIFFCVLVVSSGRINPVLVTPPGQEAEVNFVSEFFFLYFLKSLFSFYYLFIYFWLCWVFVCVRGLSPVAASGGHSSSWCAGLSLSRPLLSQSTSSRRAGSVVVAHGLSSCGSQAQLLRGMWDLPRPGLEPMSPASAGRLSTTAPPGKPLNVSHPTTKACFFRWEIDEASEPQCLLLSRVREHITWYRQAWKPVLWFTSNLSDGPAYPSPDQLVWLLSMSFSNLW